MRRAIFFSLFALFSSILFAQESSSSLSQISTNKFSDEQVASHIIGKNFNSEIIVLGVSHPDNATVNERKGNFEIMINSIDPIENVFIENRLIKINNSNIVNVSIPFQIRGRSWSINALVITASGYSRKTFTLKYVRGGEREIIIRDESTISAVLGVSQKNEDNALKQTESETKTKGNAQVIDAFASYNSGGQHAFYVDALYHNTDYNNSELKEDIYSSEITKYGTDIAYKGTDVFAGFLEVGGAYYSTISVLDKKNGNKATTSIVGNLDYLTYVGNFNLGGAYSYTKISVPEEKFPDLRNDTSGVLDSVKAIIDYLFLDGRLKWGNNIGYSKKSAKGIYEDYTENSFSTGLKYSFASGYLSYKFNLSTNTKSLFNPSYDLTPKSTTTTNNLTGVYMLLSSLGLIASYTNLNVNSNVDADKYKNTITTVGLLLIY